MKKLSEYIKENLGEQDISVDENYFEQLPENLKAHIEEGLGLNDSLFRLGSEAYIQLFEDAKEYWDKGNIILKGPSAWMAKNLEVGKEAYYQDKKVKLDVPGRGGNKKFVVYRNSGKKDDDGNIIAKKIEWGQPKVSIKNGDESAASSFWARQSCDSKTDPDTAGFWACYAPTLFAKQLGFSSDAPW